MSFWRKGARASAMRQDKPNAMPVFSVDTEEEAQQILVHFGKLGYDFKDYYWPDFGGTIDEMFEITDILDEYWRSRHAGASMGAAPKRRKDSVLFRKYPDGEVIALFPEIPGDVEGDRCLAFTRSQKYGDASCTIVMRETQHASGDESEELRRSLRYLGFDLKRVYDTTPEMLKRRRTEAKRRKDSPAFRELEMAKNLFGRLSPDVRRRLEAVIENPTHETWDAAHGIILDPSVGMGLTLWQAILAIDDTFPKVGPSTDQRGRILEPWRRIPTRELLLAALRYATH